MLNLFINTPWDTSNTNAPHTQALITALAALLEANQTQLSKDNKPYSHPPPTTTTNAQSKMETTPAHAELRHMHLGHCTTHATCINLKLACCGIWVLIGLCTYGCSGHTSKCQSCENLQMAYCGMWAFKDTWSQLHRKVYKTTPETRAPPLIMHGPSSISIHPSLGLGLVVEDKLSCTYTYACTKSTTSDSVHLLC